MTTQTSGQISIFDLKTEFSGPASPAMFDYYAGAAYVPSGTTNIPVSGAISLFQFYGASNILPTVGYTVPGTYYLGTPANSTRAAVVVRGAAGGGGGGGKAGGGDSTDIGRERGGAGGGGGGSGGTGQQTATIITYSLGATLRIVIGAGGPAGAGGTSTSYNGSWRTGQNGTAGATGGFTEIWDNNTNTLLVRADHGYGGGGGIGGSQDDFFAASGGAGGTGYIAGAPGNYNYNQYGFSGTYVITGYTENQAAATGNYPGPNAYGGAGGSNGQGGAGGAGGSRQDGVGSNGNSGSNGFAYITVNDPNNTGSSGPAATGGSNSVFPGVYQYIAYSPPTVNVCCFTADALVLMSDYSWKAIQDINIADLVMGAEGPVKIVEMLTPLLGNRRLLKFADESLTWSEEHALWAKQSDKQWWWSANALMWKDEVASGHIGGLFDNSTLLEGDKNTEWAHLSGWKHESVEVIESADSNTQLYLPKTDGSPIIINGYLVGAGVNQAAFDYTTINWDRLRNSLNTAIINKPNSDIT
jgi:hypothetical protein